MDFPTPGPLQLTEQTTGIAIDEDDQQTAAPGDEGEGVEIKFEVQTDAPEKVAEETHAPMPARGDGPANVPRVRLRSSCRALSL